MVKAADAARSEIVAKLFARLQLGEGRIAHLRTSQIEEPGCMDE